MLPQPHYIKEFFGLPNLTTIPFSIRLYSFLVSISMESIVSSFARLSLAPADTYSAQFSLEYPLRDVVLPIIVSQIHFKDPWEWDKRDEEHPVTIATIDNIRGTAS